MEQPHFYDQNLGDTRPNARFLPPIGQEVPPNPRPAVTKGLEASRRGLYTFMCVAVGFAACGGYVIYKYGDPSQYGRPQVTPTTVLISPSQTASSLTPSASPSRSPSRLPIAFPSVNPSMSEQSPLASPSVTISATQSPSEVPITPPPASPTETQPPASPTSTQQACNPPHGGYEICAVGTAAYSYPDTNRGNVVYRFNQPTVVSPECQNNQGWMLVDFSNPGGAEAGYVHTSAVTGSVGNVAICS